MLKILINAYACSPDMGSEPGMAWNWCVNIAKYCELYIITEGEFREKIEAALPTLPQGSNMHFYYLPVSEKIRKMCWNQGDWRFYLHYAGWQKRALKKAKEILWEYPIDVVHHLNMAGFREPGLFYQLGKPYIWGPTMAKEKFPVAYLQGAPLKENLKMRLKNVLTWTQFKTSRRVRKAVKHADVIVSATSESVHSFQKFYHRDTVLLNETSCDISHLGLIKKIFQNEKLKLLWVGRMNLFTKMVPLAIQSLAKTQNQNLEIHFVGGGDTTTFQQLASNLHVSDQCIWHGIVPHNEVLDMMKEMDVFFFTSTSEATSTVVLEAISNKLPVVCFDTCGQADVVDEKIGIKIPLTTPQQSAKDFADAINDLYLNRNKLKELSDNCIERAKELSWEKKAEKMVDIYKNIAN